MIAWFARNGVAANLLMFVIIALGLNAVWTRIPLEVFPEFELDIIQIAVVHRGATPFEVEEGVVIKIEEAIHEIEGIKEIRARAAEGFGTVDVEIEKGYEVRELLDDVKNKVDAIITFPDEAERPVYSIAQRRREVISVVVSGDLPERELRQLGERVRDDIVALPVVTQVELTAVRPYEVSIEVSESTLQQYGLTLESIAAAINRASLDLPAGSIKAPGGEVLLRTKGQAYVGADFEEIVVLSREDGTRLTLADVADVVDGFEENPVMARFDNAPAVVIEIYRVGEQNAIDISDAVKAYVSEAAAKMPAGVKISYWRDRARIVKARLGTLLKSAVQGGLLILVLLTLFLRFSVALWVCVGIPASFMGALALMPELGVTINVISLFAFILVLGIVVDDAIVTGENIYKHLKVTRDPTRAVIEGTHEVAVPVTFGVLTTVAAFLPLGMIEGVRGQLFAQIPIIVIPVLLFSLVESKLILPAHLKHLRIYGDDDRHHNLLVRVQRAVANGLETAILRFYRPLLGAALRQRYFTWSVFVGIAVLVLSLVAGGRIAYLFFPRVQSETARSYLTMAPGTPFEVTAKEIARVELAARNLRDAYVDPQTGQSAIKNILAIVGRDGSSNVGSVLFEIVAPEERTIEVTSSEIVREWRKRIGNIPGAQELTFRAEIGRGGNPIEVQLSGSDFEALVAMGEEVKTRLAEYPGVFDISDTADDGKEEIRLSIRPEAELLGLSASQLARQVREAFFGAEAQRIQRGREDVRVMVRFTQSERQSLDTLETMRIRTPSGVEVPFSEVASVSVGQSYSSIKRIDRNRTLNVIADINKDAGDIEAVKADLDAFLGRLQLRYPSVRYSFEGEAREQRESFGSLGLGLIFVLFVIYALLAIPFKSYLQPFIVMSVIPFGIVGAVLGHMILGLYLSVISIMGMLALIGVVINDSLVLVDYVNRKRLEGMTLHGAITTAGVVRFRPVLLTSLTTFAGLAPLIFERTTQAQFLIPMAVSLGFGVLFATFVTLILIPVHYAMLEDLRRLLPGFGPLGLPRRGQGKTSRPA